MSVGFTKSVFAGLISACLLAACGGGGGGDSGTSAANSNSSSSSAPVGVITSTNAQDTVAYAYSGVQDLGTQSNTGASLATGVSVETPTAGLITASLAQLYKGVAVQPVNNLVTGVTASSTGACPSPLQLKDAVNLNRDAHRQRMHSQRASSRQIVLPKQRQQQITGAIGHLRMLGERLCCTHVNC